MHLDRLSDAARDALEKAFARAAELRHPSVEPTHLLAALLGQTDGAVRALLGTLGVSTERLTTAVEERHAQVRRLWTTMLNGLNVATE